jgi:RND family efflux transporter MFP subunit
MGAALYFISKSPDPDTATPSNITKATENSGSVSGTTQSAQTPTISVKVGVAQLGSLEPAIQSEGAATAYRDVTLRTSVEGPYDKPLVRLGEKIKKDQIIAKIDDESYRQALTETRAALEGAKADEARARAAVERARLEKIQANFEGQRTQRMLRQGIMSKQKADQKLLASRIADRQFEAALLEARAAKARIEMHQSRLKRATDQLARVQIRAPFDGLVLEELAEPGSVLAAGESLLRIGDLSTVEVSAFVSELDLQRLSVGSEVKVSFEALPDREWKGILTQISPEIDPESRKASVTITVPNEDGIVTSGMLAQVELAPPGEPRPLVPASALDMAALTPRAQTRPQATPAPEEGSTSGATTPSAPARGEKAIVYIPVRQPDGSFIATQREVIIGKRTKGSGEDDSTERVEILEGLRPGETVITGSSANLRPGMRVRPNAMPAANQKLQR